MNFNPWNLFCRDTLREAEREMEVRKEESIRAAADAKIAAATVAALATGKKEEEDEPKGLRMQQLTPEEEEKRRRANEIASFSLEERLGKRTEERHARIQACAASQRWADLFKYEDVTIAGLQACMRGVLLRKYWLSTLKPRLMEIKQAHLASLDLAERHLYALGIRKQIQRIKIWKEYIEEWKALKNRSVTRISKTWRGKYERNCYAWIRYRAMRANYMFLQAAQAVADCRRFLAFRNWHKAYEHGR
jgi:RNase P subunit RPR2